MNKKPNISDDPLRAGGRSEPEAAELRRRAEARLRDQRKGQRSKAGDQPRKGSGSKSRSDTVRVLHELEVHQIELEMQNAELQKARDELEMALEKYTDLYDFAPVGYFSVDESGMILTVNLTGAALLGVERSRLVNRRLLLFLSPTSRPVFLAFLKKVFTGSEDQVCEALLLKEGGGTFWASFRATSAGSLSPREIASAAGPLPRGITSAACPAPPDAYSTGRASAPPISRGNGTPKWCRVAVSDIAVRKQAEDALRTSEERFRALFDSGPVAIFSCNREGVIQNYNRRAAELWGREPKCGDPRERYCGSLKLYHPDGRPLPHNESPIVQVLEGGAVVKDVEVLIERPDGSRIVVVVTFTPLKDEEGKTTGAITAFYDITERKQAEEMLRRNEAMFSALIAQAPIGVYVVDDRMCMQQVNPKALPVFRKVHPLIGRDFSEIIHVLWPRRVADQVVERFRHTLKTGAPYQSPEFAERRRDIGVKEVYEWQIQRVTLPAGAYGVVCFFNNITKRKRAEGAQRRMDVLTASNRKLKQEIVRRQAVEKALQKSEHHQSRLLGQSRHMQEQLRHLSHQILHAQEEERKRISRELHDEIAQTLVGINVHLAALSREAAGNPGSLQQKIARTQRLVEKSVDIVHRFARELRPTVLDDLGLIPALHAFMKEFTKRTGIHIRFTTFTSSRIKQLNNATRTAFYRVAQEALTNVARHAKASVVEVNIVKLPNAICLKIKDNGKSFQAQRVMHSKQNTRLGLIGMRERLEMVGGTFSVESASDKGTTVRAQIPLGKAARVGQNSADGIG